MIDGMELTSYVVFGGGVIDCSRMMVNEVLGCFMTMVDEVLDFSVVEDDLVR